MQMIRLISQSMMKKKSKFLLLVIQFTIGFMALLFGLSSSFYLLQYKKSVEGLAPLDTVHLYFDALDPLAEPNKAILNKYSEMFNRLKEKNLVKKLGMFESMDVMDRPQPTDHETRLYLLNEDSLDMSNLPLQEGTLKRLENEVNTHDTIPVVVSAAMKDRFAMGKTYQLYYMDDDYDYQKISLEVVGVLASSAHFWLGGASEVSSQILLNKEFILAPQFKEFAFDNTYESNTLIQLPKHESQTEREANLEQIQLLFKQDGLDLQVNTLQEEVDTYYQSQKVVIIVTLTFAVILLLLSLLGCMGAILASLTTRYREFGIYYALGFTKNHMIRLVYGEVMAIFAVSFIIAAVLCKVLFVTLMQDGQLIMNGPVIVVAFAIMMICTVLTTMMPLIKLKRIEPIDMIQGVNR